MRQPVTASLTFASLMLLATGCWRKSEPPPVSVPEPVASTVPVAPPKSAAAQRMDSTEYVEALKAIQTDRQTKAAEADALRQKLADRIQAVESGNEKAKALREEITTLRTDLEAKETALAELLRQDPEFAGLEKDFRQAETSLEEFRLKTAAAVREKMLEQAAGRPPGAPAARLAPEVRPALRPAPTNMVAVVPVVVTNAPPARPVVPKVSPTTTEVSPSVPKASPTTAETPGP